MIRTRSLCLAASLGIVSVIPLAAEPARGNKVDRGLVEALASGQRTLPVIVTVRHGHRADLRRALEQHGDHIKVDHPLVDALSVDVLSEDVEELAKHPWVAAVSLDAEVSAGAAQKRWRKRSRFSPMPVPTAIAPVTTLRQTLGLPKSVAPTLYSGSSGIGVAIVDSGIAPLADFAGRITGFYDFTHGGKAAPPSDDYGHGTHIASLIGASGVLSNYEFQGIAPSVHFVGLKVLDGQGKGKTSNVINALEFLIANKAALNVQIVNLSLGHPILAPAKDDPLVQAVERASEAGLVVVASAGNFGQAADGAIGYTGVTSPGNAPSAITVGSAVTYNTVSRDDNRIADYSSRGPSWFDAYAKPNVVAPGHNLPAQVPLKSYLFKLLPSAQRKSANGQALLSLSGTSMAAGVTSGVVALVLDAHNKASFYGQKPLTANLVKAMLEFSAVPVAGADYLTQGAGEINAAGSIALASAIDTGERKNGYWLRSSVTGFSTIGSSQVAWGQNIVWGGSVMSGNLVYMALPVWTSNITWGNSVVWDANLSRVVADNIVWGDAQTWAANIVWGDRVLGMMDGDNIVWGNADGDNIVWGNADGDNIVWGTFDGDNIVWGNWDGDNIVWGTSEGDGIIWGTFDGDNIVWGNFDGDNIVWGNTILGMPR